MLHIILLILKIIGWIILTILGISVLLVCTVLFAPFCYDIRGACGGAPDSLDIGMRFSYCFHLIRGTIQYRNEKLTWKLQLAWKKIGSEEETKETEKTEKATEETGRESKAEFSEKISSEAERSSPKPVPKSVSQFGLVQKETEEKTTVYMAEDEKTQTKESLLDRIDSFFEKTEYKFEEFCDKIEELLRKKELVADFLAAEEHREAFRKSVSESKRMLLRLKPKKINGSVEFGFEDPALTGKVLAVVSMLYPYFGEYAEITPRFEEKILKGDFYVKGSVAARVFVSTGVRLLLDKNIRMTMRDIKNFKFDRQGGKSDV